MGAEQFLDRQSGILKEISIFNNLVWIWEMSRTNNFYMFYLFVFFINTFRHRWRDGGNEKFSTWLIRRFKINFDVWISDFGGGDFSAPLSYIFSFLLHRYVQASMEGWGNKENIFVSTNKGFPLKCLCLVSESESFDFLSDIISYYFRGYFVDTHLSVDALFL